MSVDSEDNGRRKGAVRKSDECELREGMSEEGDDVVESV